MRIIQFGLKLFFLPRLVLIVRERLPHLVENWHEEFRDREKG